MGEVIGSQVRSTVRPRGVWRWLPRGGGALLASAVVHVAAAATVGGVLALGTRGGERPAQLVELELAPSAEPAAEVVAPAAAPPVSTPAQPVRAHPAPRRHVAMRSTVAQAADVAPAPRAAEPDQPAATPRFVMSAGTVATRAAAPRSSAAPGTRPSSQPAGSADGSGAVAGDAFGEGDVNVPARLLAPSPLVYPAAARAAAIELDFPVEIVVDPNGRVLTARALRHAGYGLDEAALRAIRDYRFSPALRAGHAVPVRMRWIVQFRLR